MATKKNEQAEENAQIKQTNLPDMPQLPDMPELPDVKSSKSKARAAKDEAAHKKIQAEAEKALAIVSAPSSDDDDEIFKDEKTRIKEILKAKKEKKRRIINTDLSKAERYNPDPAQGLSAQQVKARIDQGYLNIVLKKKGKTYPSIFISNIFTFFNILTFLVGAALIITGIAANQPIKVAKLFFLVIITANICLGIIQEIRSKRMIDRLTIMTAPSAVVVRDGAKQTVPITEIVLDDIMYLELGKQISADGIVVSGVCEVNESMLTGESEPVKKTVGSLLYSGSYISSGSCLAKVEKVGEANYIETLTSHAKRYRKPRSELQQSIRLIIKIVTCFIIPISIIMMYRGLWNKNIKAGLVYELVESWSGAVIGMIPAGMFLLTSVALAVGVLRLAKRNTLVQDLYCIEMLARADILCLDKTGTLTDGSMQVNKVVPLFKEPGVEQKIADIIGSMLTATGDNNQTALALAEKFGYGTALRPLKVQPFSSQRKYSAVTFEGEGTFILGAPEYILKEMGIRLDKMVSDYALQGYRVLCLAQVLGDMTEEGKLSSGRKPYALIVVEDHIREDAKETILWFKENGVHVKVISGDNPITVSEVAKRVGVENAELYISLDGLSGQEVIEVADKYTVFGRVTPEQKSLLVRALKAKGHTVAMTGDGVNDILAMREADCSIAIASGAEAARNASHLVLLDSNFTSMPDVVTEGRRVVNNITKSSALFLTKTCMSLVLSVIFLFLNETYPFSTDNLLLIELFVIGIPSFCLALQTNNNRIKGNFLANVISRAIPGGLALVISVMAVYFYCIGWKTNSWVVTGNFKEIQTSLWVLALSFTGIIVLAKICEPFNFYRSFVFFTSFAIMCITIFSPGLGGSFGVAEHKFFKNQSDFMHILFIATIVLLSYFIMSLILKVLKALNVLFD